MSVLPVCLHVKGEPGLGAGPALPCVLQTVFPRGQFLGNFTQTVVSLSLSPDFFIFDTAPRFPGHPQSTRDGIPLVTPLPSKYMQIRTALRQSEQSFTNTAGSTKPRVPSPPPPAHPRSEAWSPPSGHRGPAGATPSRLPPWSPTAVPSAHCQALFCSFVSECEACGGAEIKAGLRRASRVEQR